MNAPSDAVTTSTAAGGVYIPGSGLGAFKAPDAITSEAGQQLRAMVRRGVVGDVENHFPRWATSYATGFRPDVDAEGCGE